MPINDIYSRPRELNVLWLFAILSSPGGRRRRKFKQKSKEGSQHAVAWHQPGQRSGLAGPPPREKCSVTKTPTLRVSADLLDLEAAGGGSGRINTKSKHQLTPLLSESLLACSI